MPDAMAHDHHHRGSIDGAHLNYADLRNHLLASDRHACVTRELWNNGRCIYTDLRSHIMYQKARAHATYPPNTPTIASRASHPSGEGSVAGDLPALSPASQPSSSISFQPSAAYTFVGMRCVFDDSQSAVTLIKFANVRCDLLAYGDVEGNLWLVRDIQGPKATPIKAPPVHRRAITALDWSPDNTYLLTTSLDGLTVWDVAALCPIRTIATPVPANAITTAIFHCLSANMVLAGTASGMIDAINTSTGAITLNVPIFKKPQRGVHVSVLEVSAHHVFIGDSTGWLHLHKQEIPRAGQLSGLTHTSRVRIPGSDAAAPLVGCMYLAFCLATASPALLVTARDSTIAIVKVAKEHLLEVHMRCGVAPMAREIRAVVCPLSVLHCDLPRIVMGSEDTGVHIYNLSAIKAPGTPGRSGAGHGGGMLGKPLLVNTLRGHRAPVASVSWAFDETFLASADCDGMVIVWERANV